MNSYLPVRFSRFILMILVLSGLTQCSKNSNNAANASSQLCNNVKGIEAIYWDLMNGIPRGDIPGGVPVVKNFGGTYIHPSQPLLGFNFPAGYSAQTDQTQNSIGVNVFRQDNRSIWRNTNISLFGGADPQQVLNSEINTLQQFMDPNTAVQTVCSQRSSATPASGILLNTASALIRFGNFSALVHVGVTSFAATNSSMITISLSSAPTSEFANEILNTYLPISWQLLFTGGGRLDRDGDGFADNEDKFPDDPTRH